jgi:hypothetical protein
VREVRPVKNEGYIQALDMSVEQVLGVRSKLLDKINWFLSKQKDIPYSTIIKVRLPANRCVLEIGHQYDSPDIEVADFFFSP